MREYKEYTKRESHPGGTMTLSIGVQRDFKYSDFVIDELPKSCYDCPSGYMNCGVHCGRNIPFEDMDSIRRPDTCRLISYREYLKKSVRSLIDSRYIFRGKRVDTGEWVIGVLFPFSPYPVIYCDEVPYKVLPDTVSAFTGLFVISNVRPYEYSEEKERLDMLFEGDIVQHDERVYIVQKENETPGGYWASTAYILKEVGVCDYMTMVDAVDGYFNEICVKILGNKWDNPEYLDY